jgi:hypothetical protein
MNTRNDGIISANDLVLIPGSPCLALHSSESWIPVLLSAFDLVREGIESVETGLEIEFDRNDERRGRDLYTDVFELAREQELGSSLRWNDEHEGFAA